MSLAAMDPTVKLNLQTHLVNVHHQKNAQASMIGTTEQLKGAAKISASKIVSDCFGWEGPRDYPKLPKHNYLVACVDRWLDVQVFAIYSLDQMKEMEKQRGSACVNTLDWRVLEISEVVEAGLLKDVSLDDGLIVTTPEAIWGKSALEEKTSC